MKLREVFPALRETIRDFLDDHALRHGAALSFYAALSLPSLLLLLLTLGGMVFDRAAVAEALVMQMRGLMGDSGAEVADTVIEHARNDRSGPPAIVGIAVLLFAAGGVFVQLQKSMNAIWEVEAAPRKGVLRFLRKRLLSIGILLALAFLLVTSLAVSAALAALHTHLIDPLPGAELLWRGLYEIVSITVFTAIFAVVFKYLPDVVIAWRDIWMGALVTAILFTLGKSLIGMYLGRTSVAEAYGAAGSLVLLLIWVYYSALIVLFGAEFTQVHARRSGAEIRPSALARAPGESGTGAK